jgi:hypothetical protein
VVVPPTLPNIVGPIVSPEQGGSNGQSEDAGSVVPPARSGPTDAATVSGKTLPQSGGARFGKSMGADADDARRAVEPCLSALKEEVDAVTRSPGCRVVGCRRCPCDSRLLNVTVPPTSTRTSSYPARRYARVFGRSPCHHCG